MNLTLERSQDAILEMDKIISGSDQRRIDEIEVLRALAIIATLIHHVFSFLLVWPFPLKEQVYSYFTFWSGVDVFFVISGFVIARDFFERQRLGQNSYWRVTIAFWIRRAFRILPSAWIWLAAFLFGSLYLNSTGAFGNYESTLGNSIAGFFQYANYYQVQCAWLNNCSINGIYWSLSLEEQFYLVLPIVIFIFRKRLPYVLGIILLSQFFIGRPEWSYLWAFRTDGFIFGILIALWSGKKTYQKFAPKMLSRFSVLRWIALTVLVLSTFVIPAPQHGIPFSLGLLSLNCGLLVWLASYDRGYLLMDGFFRRGLVWIGRRSYAIYLTHIFAFRFVLQIYFRYFHEGFALQSDYPEALVAAGLILTFTLSELNFIFVEQPLRKVGKRISDRFERAAS